MDENSINTPKLNEKSTKILQIFKTKSLKENSIFRIPVKHYSLAKCAFFNNYYIGNESNSEYFTMKSTEKLNPFVFDEDIDGQSNSFVHTFTVRVSGHARQESNAARRAVVLAEFSSSKIFRRMNNKQINKVLNGFHGQLIRDLIVTQNI